METMRKKEATTTACSEDNRKGVHGISMDGQYDPWNPAYPPRDPGPCDADIAAHIASVKEWMNKTEAILANSRATKTIIPDRTPQKLFLDTTRLLAKHTDDLLDELCKYIVDGKIVHTAVLLLAAQKQIRGLSSCNGGGNSKKDGFGTITNFVVDNITAIKMHQNRLEMKPLEVKKELFDVTLNLVHVIFKAGEALDVYIRSHPKMPCVMEVAHAEVFEHVTLILKDHGFFSTGDGIDIGNLHPYENVLSSRELPHKLEEMARIKAGLKVPCLRNGKPKVKKDPRGWELKFARRSFFQSWRSVLTSELGVKLCALKEKTYGMNISDKSTGEASMFMGGTLQPKINYQSRRMFGTVALTLLKALRKA